MSFENVFLNYLKVYAELLIKRLDTRYLYFQIIDLYKSVEKTIEFEIRYVGWLMGAKRAPNLPASIFRRDILIATSFYKCNTRNAVILNLAAFAGTGDPRFLSNIEREKYNFLQFEKDLYDEYSYYFNLLPTRKKIRLLK